ncbi:MAG TPA: GGDEF domain-containing protein [Treponemataceae bacterium]|nr:GGDEF domain-containing protein [Treponemataceae bacterium]
MAKKRIRIAVLMDFVFSQFQEEARQGIDRYRAEADIDAVYFGLGSMVPDNPEDRARLGFLEMIRPAEFDGVIVVSTSFVNSSNLDFVRDRLGALKCMPMVSMGQSILGEDAVSIDDGDGMRRIMRHLIEDHGYRDFAYVSGPLANGDAAVRYKAFRAALAAAGIPHREESVYEGNFLPPSGESAVAELFDRRGLKPQAIVCANDLMALGVWNAVRERGLNVPFDVAITGYDDSQVYDIISTQFTTVKQSFADLGYQATGRLHARIRGEASNPFVPLSAELRVRGSCGCVDYASRATADRACAGAHNGDSTRGAAMKARIGDFIAAGCPPEEKESLWRAWLADTGESLEHGENAWCFERVLQELRDRAHPADPDSHTDPAPGSAQRESLLSDLYALLLEECGHKAFSEYWRENIFSIRLRVLVDRLQDTLVQSRSIMSHDAAYREIADLCGVGEFHLMRFADFRNMLRGSSVVYSTGVPEASADVSRAWMPGPGSWFPPGCRSLVANMVSGGDERFGYILMGADAPHASAYEFIRIRFSIICKDLRKLTSIHRLNEQLKSEVAVREETELKLKEALAMVEELSLADELTGLRNRRGFFALAEQQIKYLRRQSSGFFVLYADLDGLKAINDKWGHNDGDLAIRAAGEVLQLALRESDIVARLGGDEFTALVNKADPPHYAVIRDRIIEGCERKSRELARPWKLSMSLGHFHGTEGCQLSLTEMLEVADGELYREKQAKRVAYRI